MKLIYYAAVIFYVALSSPSGCIGGCSDKPGGREYREVVKAYGATNAEPRRRFLEYSMDKQIDIYLFSRNCTGDTRIEPLILLNGEKIVPTIVGRIEEEPNLLDKSHLVTVLIGLNTKCRCIAADSETIRRLERVANELDKNEEPPDDTYKVMYRQSVTALKQQLEGK